MHLSNMGWRFLPVLFLLGQAGVAVAVDTREVVIQAQEDLAAVPPHVGHVLASPNRGFTFDRAEAHWSVTRDYSSLGAFRDRNSYLKHRDNAFVETFYFDFDSASPLDKEWIAPAVVDRLLKLKSRKGIAISVYGHADEAGSATYNMHLSRERAEAVRRVMTVAGLHDVPVTVLARGKEEPASFHNQSLNRRVEVVVRAPSRQRQELREGAEPVRQPQPRQVRPLGLPVAPVQGVMTTTGNASAATDLPRASAQSAGLHGVVRQPTVPTEQSVKASQPSATVEALLGGAARNASRADGAGVRESSPTISAASTQTGTGSDEHRIDRNPLGAPHGPVINPLLTPSEGQQSLGGR